MKIVINKSGKTLKIPELQRLIPWDGKKYLLPDNIANKYYGFLEVVDLDNNVELLQQQLKIESEKNINFQILLDNYKQNIKNMKIDFLYSFHFNENQEEHIKRLRFSIKSIINQNVNVCVCNTSKKCI
jgi:hypothetical protein